MERDFLGLSSRNVSKTAKEENYDAPQDSVQPNGSMMQWSFLNKVSAVPQFLSFKAAQEDRLRKTLHDSLAPPGFMQIPNGDIYDTNHKSYSGIVQKSLVTDKQAGIHYTIGGYPPQHFDGNSVQRPWDVRAFPVSSQMNPTVSPPMSSPFQSYFASMGQNMLPSNINSQLLGGPSTNSINGNTDLRNTSKPSGGPSQLTIFYGGSVNVYNDISPEKAQAIMLLARNAPSTTPKPIRPTALSPRALAVDGSYRNHSHNSPPRSGLTSPISITSNASSQSVAISRSLSELLGAKSAQTLTAHPNQSEPPNFIPAAVPQLARKASLARFLEKRKERVMTAIPYNLNKKSPECSAT